MGLRIGHNVETAAVQRHLGLSASRLATSMQRLSSGLRVNSAADDAAGLGISEQMRGQIRGLEKANRNIQDGIALLNTMEAALDGVHSILQRARELAVQYNNGTYSWTDKGAIASELAALCNEIYRIEQSAQFNGIDLLQDATALITLQTGAGASETFTFHLEDLFGGGTNLVRSISFQAWPWLGSDITGLDANIGDVADARGRIGAYTTALEHRLSANQAIQESLMAAESRIRDVDVAQEMAQLARQRILQQGGTRLLAAQAQSRERVNSLLG